MAISPTSLDWSWKRHLGVLGMMKLSFHGNPYIRVVFFSNVLIRKFILGNQHLRDHYIHRELCTNKPTSVAEWELLFWKLILLRADIGIFLLMVWKLILLIFRSAGYFLFRETRPAMTRSFFCCEMLCANGTHYVSQDVLSIILDDLDEKSNPKKINELSSHVGSLHPLNSWNLGVLDSTTS